MSSGPESPEPTATGAASHQGGLSDMSQQPLRSAPAAIQCRRVMLVIGTRPEAIKMAGVVSALRAAGGIDWHLCSTGQHKSMLQDTLADLGIEANSDLHVMNDAKNLSDIAAIATQRLDGVMEQFQPDWVLVQGDTTTAFAGALAAFHRRIAVGHVEAGLRTGNRYSPWPEEINRKLVGVIASRHFVPTTTSRDNLLRENVPANEIVVTGNTVIDALLAMRERTRSDAKLKAELEAEFAWRDRSRRMILVTGHRRESFGDGFRQICEAVAAIADRGDVEIVYPVHLNPNVQQPVNELLGSNPRIRLIAPQGYARFVYLMDQAHILLTDSGGIQEEGPSLGKPVLVMRETSERPEAIAAGAAKLVGTNPRSIVGEVTRLLDDPVAYQAMTNKLNPYGDGTAGRKIIEALRG
ncbi:MAG: non-hydrolyzing UDP-N-acetylglucosamine 2-epimerase [Hyphomicrobiaceae bacterium]